MQRPYSWYIQTALSFGPLSAVASVKERYREPHNPALVTRYNITNKQETQAGGGFNEFSTLL